MTRLWLSTYWHLIYAEVISEIYEMFFLSVPGGECMSDSIGDEMNCTSVGGSPMRKFGILNQVNI